MRWYGVAPRNSKTTGNIVTCHESMMHAKKMQQRCVFPHGVRANSVSEQPTLRGSLLMFYKIRYNNKNTVEILKRLVTEYSTQTHFQGMIKIKLAE